MSARRLVLLLLAVAAVAGGATARGVLDTGDDAAGTMQGRVVKVVDGDTIHVQVGATREKVRYIGVDTPVLWSRDVFPSMAAASQRR